MDKSREELTTKRLKIDDKVLDLCYPRSREKQTLNERVNNFMNSMGVWTIGGADAGAVIGSAAGVYFGETLEMKLGLAMSGIVRGVFLGGILGYAGGKLAEFARRGKDYCKLKANEFLEDRVAEVKQLYSGVINRKYWPPKLPSVPEISEKLSSLVIPAWFLSAVGLIYQNTSTLLLSGSIGLACFNNSYNYLRSKNIGQTLRMAALGAIVSSEVVQKIIGSECKPVHYGFYAAMFYVMGQVIANRMTVRQFYFPDTFGELEEELNVKIDQYQKIKDSYANNMPGVIGEDGMKLQVSRVNAVLNANMRKRSTDQVSLDIVSSNSSDVTARADPFSKTVRIYDRIVRKCTPAEFATIYSHEMVHMDLILNDGAANFFAYRILEKLDELFPHQGYDLAVAEQELIAMLHNYTNLLKLSGASRDFIKKRLKDFAIDEDIRKTVVWWTYPSLHLGTIFGLQSIAFGNNKQGGYTIDQYQLYKEYQTMKKSASS